MIKIAQTAAVNEKLMACCSLGARTPARATNVWAGGDQSRLFLTFMAGHGQPSLSCLAMADHLVRLNENMPFTLTLFLGIRAFLLPRFSPGARVSVPQLSSSWRNFPIFSGNKADMI